MKWYTVVTFDLELRGSVLHHVEAEDAIEAENGVMGGEQRDDDGGFDGLYVTAVFEGLIYPAKQLCPVRGINGHQ